MRIKLHGMLVIACVVLLGTCLAFAAVIPNRPCLTCPAGSTQGGDDCAAKDCYYIAGMDPHFRRHFAYSYTKCGSTEYHLNCTQSDIAYPYGYDQCALAKRYANMLDCQNDANGSASQVFRCSSPKCTT